MKKPTFIDLFSGAGGLGIGLQKAGFQALASVDFDKDAIETLRGHSGHNATCSDIGNFIDELEHNKREFRNLDLLAGASPCQGFCAINPNRHENDPRNSLVDAFCMLLQSFSQTSYLSKT